MATTADIRQIAAEVRENANDLRMMEVLTNWIYSDNGRMPYAGDSDVDDWNMYRANIPTRDMVVQEYEQRYGVVAGTEFDHIPPLIESYGTEPGTYDEVLAILATASEGFNGVGPAQTAQTELAIINTAGGVDWTGDFADEFSVNVLAEMPAVQGRQHNVLCELQAAVMAHREMVEKTNEAIYQIGVATRDALVNAIHARVATDEGAIGWTIVGLAAGTVLAAAGLALAEPAGAAFVLSVVGAVKGVGEGTVATAKATKSAVAGDQVDVIMGSMHAAITQLAADIDQAESDLAGALGGDLDEFENTLAKATGKAQFEGIRPHLADERPSSEEFKHAAS